MTRAISLTDNLPDLPTPAPAKRPTPCRRQRRATRSRNVIITAKQFQNEMLGTFERQLALAARITEAGDEPIAVGTTISVRWPQRFRME